MEQEEKNNKLIKAYQKLSPVLKCIIKILGVNVNMLSQNNVNKSLNAVDIYDETSTPLSQKAFRSHLLNLADQGFIIKKKGSGITCPEKLLFYAAMDAAINNQFEKILLSLESLNHNELQYLGYYDNIKDVYKAIQTSVYCGDQYLDIDTVYSQGAYQLPMEFLHEPPFLKIFNRPFHSQLFDNFKPGISLKIITYMINESERVFEPVVNILRYARQLFSLESDPEIKCKIAESYLLHGRKNIHTKLLKELDDVWSWQFEAQKGCAHMISNQNESALIHFRKALALYKKETRKRKIFFPGYSGLFFLFALIKSGNNADYKIGLDFTEIALKSGDSPPLPLYGLKALFQEKLGIPVVGEYDSDLFSNLQSSVHLFFNILIATWLDLEEAKINIDELDDIREKAAASDYLWIEAEACALLAILGKDIIKNKNRSKEIHKECSTSTITDIVKPNPQWEKKLLTLINIGKQFNKSKKTEISGELADTQRLIWILEYSELYKTCDLKPRLQKLTKKNTWTKGRAVALKNLYQNFSTIAGLSDQDQIICRTIVEESFQNRYYYGHKIEYRFDFTKALPAIVNHPLIFLETSLATPVELVKGEPELRLRVIKDKINILMNHLPSQYDDEVIIIRETPSRYKVICFSKEQKKLADFLGENGLEFPKKAEKMAIDAMANLSPIITVNSDLVSKGDKNGKTIKADPTPNVHVMPWEEGISIEFLVRPFIRTGSYFKPGRGGKNVFAEIKEKKVQAIRNLEKEKEFVKTVIEKCPTLDLLEEVDGQWLVGDPEDALELLLELKSCEENIIMAWPRGEKMKVRSKVSFNNFTLNIKKERDWFKASGTLKIDENMAVDLSKLMTLLENSSGRFITLDDGTFLAITNTLKERLEELKAYSTPHKKGLRFSPLAAPAIEELIDKAGTLKSDKAWKNHCKKLKEVVQPEIPGTLQANLRDYQKIGFNWLSQLAHWNVGACLADDMGLGKTVQALAAVLIHAAKGPTLVVAPLSVMANWQEECHNFAPTLNPLVFGPGDRQQFLDNLKPFDIVVSSYGLLQMEGEKLANVDWQIIVLDEAQAIKNMKTKRSRAAMKLKAQFRIITTGTPVENHLIELWTLFNFLNPGLLGSIQNFKNSFAVPIEQDQDKKASHRLRKLIQPFILRRLKSDVLKELPEKTQITLEVEMSKEEALLYEAQRLKALENIEAADDKPGQKHLRILAQLTRLRQLCCNPALLLPDTDIKSSKLKVFGNVIDELLENNHKALVFSQFVGHLSILRKFLDKKNISYQYLDGSTSVKKRKKRIDAFQNGVGDVFLISLKAGGFGLNLTAADYVIHMDPWWNPAVEDQASDRAHRIGQTRPVTVYRLVVKDSIEEQIVTLHKEKRELADSLLTGSDIAGKVSAAELLTLLQDHHNYGKIKS